MKTATKKDLMAFRKTLPSVPVEPRKKPKRVKDKREVNVAVTCRGGKGCTRGMTAEDGSTHYVKFSRRRNVMCTCWMRPKTTN